MGKECFQLLFSKVQVLFVWFLLNWRDPREESYSVSKKTTTVFRIKWLAPCQKFWITYTAEIAFIALKSILKSKHPKYPNGRKMHIRTKLYLYLKFLLKRRTVPNSNCFKRVFYNRALDAVWLPVNALKISRRRGNIILLVMCVTHHAWYYVQVVLHIV